MSHDRDDTFTSTKEIMNELTVRKQNFDDMSTTSVTVSPISLLMSLYIKEGYNFTGR